MKILASKVLWHRRVVASASAVLTAGALILAGVMKLGASEGSRLSQQALSTVGYEQRLGEAIPLELTFTNSAGKRVRIGDLLAGKPAILVLGYYECPMLCSVVMNGLIESLHQITPSAGDKFSVMMVSVDPSETPESAESKRQASLRRYGRKEAGAAWHFLTGEKNSIEDLAKAVGFSYRYDPSVGEYAHPSGIIILTPMGKISRYMFGVRYSAVELERGIRAAGMSEVSSPIEQLLLLCFGYNPENGPYTNAVLVSVRAAGVLTVLLLAGTIVTIAWRTSRAGNRAEGGSL